MGDRGNIKIYFGGSTQPIFFYTHWTGSDVQRIVKTAIARRERWHDTPYLARIIFCELVKGNEDNTTGFGISPFICDNEHEIIGVNPEKQEITFEDESGNVNKKMFFEEFMTRDLVSAD